MRSDRNDAVARCVSAGASCHSRTLPHKATNGSVSFGQLFFLSFFFFFFFFFFFLLSVFLLLLLFYFKQKGLMSKYMCNHTIRVDKQVSSNSMNNGVCSNKRKKKKKKNTTRAVGQSVHGRRAAAGRLEVRLELAHTALGQYQVVPLEHLHHV